LNVTPSEIIGEAGDDIELVCEANVEESISADYSFAWLFNDVPVNRLDPRIDVCLLFIQTTVDLG